MGARLAEDGSIVFKIPDTGIGMAVDDLQKALEPFGQVDSSLSRKYEGTGLGQPLTVSLVEAHGGKLNIKSAPGEGTVVSVHFGPERVISLLEAS